MDLEAFRKKAGGTYKEHKDFLLRLKKKRPKDLDQRFHTLHEEVFEEIDCLECANCCKTTSPIFRMTDIERLAKSLKTKPHLFIEQYLHLDNEGDYVLNEAPCPFLAPDNYCMVYESRPNACREYPHTDRRKMHQIMNLTVKNTLVCPAVLEIVERMKIVFKSLK